MFSIVFFTVFFKGERRDQKQEVLDGGFGRKIIPPPGKPIIFYKYHPDDHIPAPSVRANFIFPILFFLHFTICTLYSTLYTPHSTLRTTFDALHLKLHIPMPTAQSDDRGLQSALLITKNLIYLLKILPTYYIFYIKRFSAILQLYRNIKKCHDIIEKERFWNFPPKYNYDHKKIRSSRRNMLYIQKKDFVRKFLKFSYFVISKSIFSHDFFFFFS